MKSPFEEVTSAERMEIASRLYRAQCYFEDQRNTKLKDKARRLDEKFGGMQELVTRYDLNAANEFLSDHGFGPKVDTPTGSSSDEWENEWISVAIKLPEEPPVHKPSPVTVRFGDDDEAETRDAWYVNTHSSYNPKTVPCFVVIEQVVDALNPTARTERSVFVDPTHWRPREA
ncbi:hypothetical protein I7819_25235 [Burkholderia multivorans]|uniref:hypothetical protein n=1 Tax=Burkholderia multivorans TaxID=87883 RepID=UPI0019056AC6|nr:hypothetical protein [Burkholderia multivorans]MBJ9943183.1 hypothetical protein [Burkholderia multivorans]MBU9288775.1 hypothetical protein [Burkholderia multivorans]